MKDKKQTTRRRKPKSPRSAAHDVTWWMLELPAFEPEDFEPDQEYWQLFRDVNWLSEHVRAMCRADTPIARLFNLAFPANSYDDERLPCVKGLTAARQAFIALSPDQQRSILRGWAFRLEHDAVTREDLEKDSRNLPVRQVLSLRLGHGDRLLGSYDGVYCDTRRCVHLAIDVGATLHEVLSELRA